MQVIEEVGIQVNSEAAQQYFKQAGAYVDQEKRLVRLPKKLVTELIEKAPSEFTLCGKDNKNDISIMRDTAKIPVEIPNRKSILPYS